MIPHYYARYISSLGTIHDMYHYEDDPVSFTDIDNVRWTRVAVTTQKYMHKRDATKELNRLTAQ